MRVAVVVAAGSGTRSGATGNKALVELAGVTVLRRSVDAMVAGGADRVVVVTRPIDRGAVAAVLAGVDHAVVDGGDTRQRSEAAGVAAAADLGAVGAGDVIAVHDAARPLVSPELVAAVFEAARDGVAYPATEVHDVWVADDDGGLVAPVDGPLLAAQTPQAARADLLVAAHRGAADGSGDATDTVEVVVTHTAAATVTVVAGEPTNLKVTWPNDFAVAGDVLGARREDGPADSAPPVESGAVQQIHTIDSGDAAEAVAPDTTVTPAGAVTPAEGAAPDEAVTPAEGAAPGEADEVATDALAAELDDVEQAVADAQIALDCLATAGADICGSCQAAEADGTLADRPALARCVAAKRA